MKIFITGTDTNIGKTIISAWLCVHFNASYWKPVQSGSKEDEIDSRVVKKILNGDDEKIIPEKYILEAPLSPHLAAQMEGKYIQMSELELPDTKENLIVEGAGGILVPINNEATMLDLVQQIKIPVIIVARSALGTINHTCLTIEALKGRKIPILGVIMNGPKNENNKKAIEKYGGFPVLDEVEKFRKLDHSFLKARVPSKKLIEAINEFSTVR
jgi:dethiobiotin synthetase